MLKKLIKLTAFLVILNEIRGIILAVPVFYGLIVTGGTWMAVWVAICSLAGIALSIIIPTFILRRLNRVA